MKRPFCGSKNSSRLMSHDGEEDRVEPCVFDAILTKLFDISFSWLWVSFDRRRQRHNPPTKAQKPTEGVSQWVHCGCVGVSKSPVVSEPMRTLHSQTDQSGERSALFTCCHIGGTLIASEIHSTFQQRLKDCQVCAFRRYHHLILIPNRTIFY